MKTQKELNEIIVDIDFYDHESIIKGFLTLSALNRINEFDFKEAFDVLISPIEHKLIEHAQCDYDDFASYYDDVFYRNESDFEKFTYQTDYIYITTDDVREAICKMHYEKSKESFDGMFDNLLDIKERVDNMDENDTKSNIILFDEIIHAQHVTGDIFDDIDIESIKSDLDETLLELMGINA